MAPNPNPIGPVGFTRREARVATGRHGQAAGLVNIQLGALARGITPHRGGQPHGARWQAGESRGYLLASSLLGVRANEVDALLTRDRSMPLVASLALALSAGACRADRNDPEARKVIDETRDEAAKIRTVAAKIRTVIEDKEEQLAREQGRLASERGEFTAAAEKRLAELDRQIQQLRAAVQERAAELKGNARRELDRELADLERARAQAQSGLDRLRHAASEKVAQIQQETETALERTRNALDAPGGRVRVEKK